MVSKSAKCVTVGLSLAVVMHEANLLRTTLAVGPQPPAAEKTSGEKHPISTSQTHW